LGITATNAQSGWTSDSPDSWIAVTSGASATGSGQAVFNVTPPAGTSTQSGTAIAAGQVVSLACGSSCTVSAPNSIVFGPLPDIVMGAPPFAIAATASSGLPVAFNSGTGSVCTVSGATVTIAATGTCSITASQPGNAIYSAALPVIQSFTVTGQKPQSIAFTAPESVPSGTSPFNISATATSGLPVEFSSPSTSACTVSGSTVTIAPTAASTGSCSITAAQPGDATYSAAPAVTRTFPVLGSTEMRWSIHAVFGDGGNLSGYFVLDTSNSKVVDWDIAASPIGTVFVTPPVTIPPFDLNPETSYQGSSPTLLTFQSYPAYYCPDSIGNTTPWGSIVLWATMASAPTNAGGTIEIVPYTISEETIACGETRPIISGWISTLPLTDSPTYSPAPGTYTSNQTVTIADTTPNSTIYYTTDGSAPTTSSPQYSGPVTVSKNEVIQSIAAATGYADSPVASATYAINIPPNFTIGANPGSLTLASGSQSAITLTVTPQNGFSAAVTFACSGLPAGVTCAFNPSTVTPNGPNGATTSLTIAASASALNQRPSRYPFLPGATLAVCIALFVRKRRAIVWGTAVFLLSGCVLGLSACGGGSSGGGGGGGGKPPTNATVTVTATSGSLSQTATIALTITH
jgi:Chitobiase/beta-hexosaminidase C-terminal domain